MRIDDFVIRESPIIQEESETVVYTLTTTPWGRSPTSPIVIVTDKNGTTVTSSVTTGTPTVASDIITLPPIHSLLKSLNPYLLKILFTVDGNRLSTWAELLAR